jgi:HK97 family phage major capsid protein
MTQMTREQALANADSILKQRNFTKEDSARVESLLNYAGALPRRDEEAVRLRAAQLGKEMHVESEPEPKAEVYKRAFLSYLLLGEEGMPAADKRLLMDSFAKQRVNQRMDSTGGAYPGSMSGFLTPTLFEKQLISQLKAYDRICDDSVVTWFSSTKGGPWALPDLDDTIAEATIVSQGSMSAQTDIGAVGSVQFNTCPTWRSGIIPVSIELEQDSAFALIDALSGAFGVRFARGIGKSFVAELMSKAAPSGQTVIGDDSQAVPDPTSQVGYEDLLNLVASVDPAYGSAPSAGWLMTFRTLISLLGLRDKANRPLLPIERNSSGDFVILDRPVFISPSMDNIGSGKKPIAYGDLKRFIVRHVTGSTTVARYNEIYATSGQVGFQGYMRAQGTLALTTAASPVSYPVRYLVQP